MAGIAFLIFALPLAGFVVNGLFGRRMTHQASGWLASMTVFGSFVFGLLLLYSLLLNNAPATFNYFDWIQAGDFKIPFAFHIDNLALIMILTVSGVSGLIHVYSIGYMEHDRDYSRYFAHLNLFTSMMLLLVMADNLPVMFIGWEGVGLCSYLLIGFWYEKDSAANAARKAFVVNRIGDAAFIVGMLLLYLHFGTLGIQSILQKAPELFSYGSGMLTAITILLFIGATGKSAQFPLHVWLPDAMEGPTPVSALIHAATMVTAGVYMVARLNLLYLMSPATLWIIGIIAVVTSFGAALVALSQYDIKRVLAYSTISQIGFMFLALSVGAFGAAIFHLFTHAFFKALLFLGAGAVIHSLNNEMDMRRMGGLARSIPITSSTFLIGTLAISGFPFMAGFFSKDLVIESTFTNPIFHKAPLGVIGLIISAFTAFYMFRLYYRIFRGRFHGVEDAKPHDAPTLMAFPMIVLAFFSVFAGFLGLPLTNLFTNFLEPVFGQNISIVAKSLGVEMAHESSIPWGYWFLSLVAFIFGWFLSYLFFIAAPEARGIWKKAYPRLWTSLSNKFYVDKVYDDGLVAPGKIMFRTIWLDLDLGLVDAIVNGIGSLSVSLGRVASFMTTGYIRNYALYMVIGIIILLLIAFR